MDNLTRNIQHRLGDHTSCTVFEKELAAVWPSTDEAGAARCAQIKAYAKARGWSATIMNPGIRVTFRQLALAKPA